MTHDYKNELNKLKIRRLEIANMDKFSPDFKKVLKTYLKDLIFLKGHPWCMDNQLERNKMLKLIWQDIEFFQLI